MDKLLKGIVEFQSSEFEEHRALFKELGNSQNPHTLFIGCSDSRVVPNMITKTLPGELFMIRNIGNLVPPYRETEEFVATTSAIEYAVEILNVENIVVCGHSNCGACQALHMPDDYFKKIPHVKKWLELANPAKIKAEQTITNGDKQALEWATEQINITEQIKNLFTYPFVKERYVAGKLKIYGLYYIIETGEIYNYNPENHCFEKLR